MQSINERSGTSVETEREWGDYRHVRLMHFFSHARITLMVLCLFQIGKNNCFAVSVGFIVC